MRVIAGLKRTRFRLAPGEEVRLPSILTMNYDGDWIDGQNQFRRLMLAHFTPKNHPPMTLMPVQAGVHGIFPFNETSEEKLVKLAADVAALKLPLDCYHLDAGWNEGGFPRGQGNPQADPVRFPNGLAPVGAAVRKTGMRFLAWFEPERAMRGTWMEREHPDWLLKPTDTPERLRYQERDGFLLLDLGNPKARQWAIESVSEEITRSGLDFYRQDFNLYPAYFWHTDEKPDEIGLREIRHINGLYEFLDELARRHPEPDPRQLRGGRPASRLRDDASLHRALAQRQHLGPRNLSSECPGHDPRPLALAAAPRTRRRRHRRSGPAQRYGRVRWLLHQLPQSESRRRVAEASRQLLQSPPAFTPATSTRSRLTRSTQTSWIAWQFHRADLGESVVQAFRRPEAETETLTVKLRGLDPQQRYEIENLDGGKEVRTGAELMRGLRHHPARKARCRSAVSESHQVKQVMKPTLTLLTTLLLAPLAALHAASVEMLPMSEPDEAVPLPELSFYVKRETLPRTLVATRLALRQWQEEQARTRPAVAWGVWQATELMPEPAPETLPAPDARQPDGRPLWRACPEWKPATVIPLAQGKREQAAVWLRNTLTASGPVTLCVGLGGGDRLDVFLDGKLLKSLDTRIRLKRYGTGLRDEQRFPDQCFVDLTLEAGTHDLQLRLAQVRINWTYPWHLTPFRFWFSPAPEPAPHLWQRVLRDYPRYTHALVDGVNHAWFGDAGWLAARDTRFEREYLAGVGLRHAPLAQTLQARVATLDAAATPPDDPRWLELCVAAAEADRAWTDLDRLAAAVEKLGREFPSVYPAGAYAARIEALRANVAALAATDPEGLRARRAARGGRGAETPGAGSGKPAAQGARAGLRAPLHLRFAALLRRLLSRPGQMGRQHHRARSGDRADAGPHRPEARRRHLRPLRPVARRQADRLRLPTAPAGRVSHLGAEPGRHGPAPAHLRAGGRGGAGARSTAATQCPFWRAIPACTATGPTTCTPAICRTGGSSSCRAVRRSRCCAAGTP